MILSLSLLLTIGFTAVSASPIVDPDPEIEKLFQKEFSGAEYVKWGEEAGHFSVSFVLGGQRTKAWFSKNGELVGSMRNLFFTQLPLNVIRSVQSRFEGSVGYDVTEVSNADGTRYKLTLEYKKKKYRVSVLPDGNFEEARRLKK